MHGGQPFFITNTEDIAMTNIDWQMLTKLRDEYQEFFAVTVDFFKDDFESLDTVPHATLWGTGRWRQKVLSELVKLSRKERSKIIKLISFSYTPGQLATGSNSERNRIEKKL